MRIALLIAISLAAFSAEERPTYLKPGDPGYVDLTAGTPAPVRTITDADLQNLVACARLQLQALTPDQMVSVAQAIKRAEADIEASKKAQAIPVEVKSP
jgi:hypothetical protein